MENFYLRHVDGKLFAHVTINGVEYSKEVTEYFEGNNAHDDWLDYRIFGK